MKFGEFELSIIRESTFKLDGGAMFGVVPKTLWGKVARADEANRILLSCNLLLIDTGERLVLVETGMGDRWSEKERERYDLKLLLDHAEALKSAGYSNDDVDAVIISHLHFDHAGGATRLDGEQLVPTYRNARYYIQSGEWKLAHEANARARASYRPGDFEPLAEYGVLRLIEGDFEVVPGVWCRITGGHTSHHQVVTFESKGRTGVYFADIMPTHNHLSPPWVMGYDHYPLESCDVKTAYLSRAVAEQWLVVFDHEPGTPWGYVRQAAGKFTFQPLPEQAVV